MRELGVALAAMAVIAFGSTAWSGPRGVVRSYDFANGSGSIDYDSGFIEATATGTADMRKMVNSVQAETVALRTARHLAYEVLAETVGKIQIDSKTLYQNAMASIDALKTETHAVIRGAMPVDQGVEWVRDRRTKEEVPVGTVTLRLYLTGEEGLGHLIDKYVPPPVVQPATYDSRPVANAPEAEGQLPGQGAKPRLEASPEAPPGSVAPQTAQPGRPIGSLVVDARSVASAYQPAVRLLIRDQEGKVVYGPEVGGPSLAQERKRPFRYATSLEEAKALFAGEGEPLVVKAAAAPAPGDLLLDAADARAVLQASKGEAFLREAKVAVIVE